MWPRRQRTAQPTGVWRQRVNLGGGLEVGSSLALSADGNVAVVGSPGTSFFLPLGGATISAHRNGSWQNAGQIGGRANADSGRAVAVSGNGQRVIVGSPGSALGVQLFNSGPALSA